MDKETVPGGQEKIYGTAFVLMLALTPLLAIIAPRFFAAWPGLIGLAGWLAWPSSFGPRPRLPRGLLFWIALFMGLGALSSLWAIDPGHAVSRALKTAAILFPGAVLVAVAAAVPIDIVRQRLPYIIWICAAVLLFWAAELAFKMPVYRLLHHMSDARDINLSETNRSVIALLCLFFSVLGMARFKDDRKGIAGLLAGCVGVLCFSSSQSAQLGFVMALVCYLWFPYGQKKVWTGFALVLAGLVLAAPFLAMWMYHALAADVAQMPWLGRGGGFGGERLEIWDKVGRYAMKRPFWGFGMEATRAITDFDTAQTYRKGVTELHPHNFAIQLWIEFGLIGAALGAAALWRLCMVMAARPYAQARLALPAFLILLSPAAFGYGLWQGWFVGLMIFTIAFTVLGMRVCDRQDAEIPT